MLINGRHAEELRVAVVQDQILEYYQVEFADASMARGNIYRGVVANIESSLDAAFIEYGADRHGFLTRHDVLEPAWHHHPKGKGSWRIDDVLQKGRPILVQVTKDARGSKGAMLTTNISLAGRYLVLMPHDDCKGLSRKVEGDALRKEIKDKVKSLAAPHGFGYIVRTNAVDQTKTALKSDLAALARRWKKVLAENKKGKGPRLIHDDQDMVVQAVRDYLDSSIDEVVLDNEELLERAKTYMDAAMPRSKISLTLYTDRSPLFTSYNIEPQVSVIYNRVVPLPSGGSIVIDPTEALTAIDVNSGKATTGATQSETAYNTNLEAADEVARQLRLRNIGGLVVVDFIDMRSRGHQRKVEKRLSNAMKKDKARFQLSQLSANGLLEINRQRIGQALQLRTHRLCPACQGLGRLINVDLAALYLLRRLEARAATGRLQKAIISLHPQLAEFIQNRRREQIAALERDWRMEVEILGVANFELSEEKIQWINRPAGAERPALSAEKTKEAPAAKQRPAARAKSRRKAEPAKKSEPQQKAEPAKRSEPQHRAEPEAREEHGTSAEPEPQQEADAKTEPDTRVEGDRAQTGKASRSRGRRRRRRPRRRSSNNGPQDQSASKETPAAPKNASGSEETAKPTARRSRRRRRGGRRRGGNSKKPAAS